MLDRTLTHNPHREDSVSEEVFIVTENGRYDHQCKGQCLNMKTAGAKLKLPCIYIVSAQWE